MFESGSSRSFKKLARCHLVARLLGIVVAHAPLVPDIIGYMNESSFDFMSFKFPINTWHRRSFIRETHDCTDLWPTQMFMQYRFHGADVDASASLMHVYSVWYNGCSRWLIKPDVLTIFIQYIHLLTVACEWAYCQQVLINRKCMP